jgi:hypothetical protein
MTKLTARGTMACHMPVHDWTNVGPGIFHDFHHTWIAELKRALNAGILPNGYYALAEQIAGGFGPDVLALESSPEPDLPNISEPNRDGGVAVAASPPKVQFHARAEVDQYAAKAKAVVIRHSSDHHVVAVVEIISPGNKGSRPAFRNFVEKADGLIRAGVHLLLIDLFPPGLLDAGGIHNAIWKQFGEDRFDSPTGRPLSLASYLAAPCPEAFVEPLGVNEMLPDMPLFLGSDWYVPSPLERTYKSAWDAVPSIWREAVTGRSAGTA